MAKSPVTKLLEKRGLNPEELTPEERSTLEAWKETLKAGQLKTSDIAAFCRINLSYIERQFKDFDRSTQKTERLVLLHSVYSAIIGLIDNPQDKKKALESYLTSLI